MKEILFETIYEGFLIEGVYVTVRKYPKRYFVAYEDYRNDLSGGSDVEDTYDAPVVVWKKIPHAEFDLKLELKMLKDYLAGIQRNDFRSY